MRGGCFSPLGQNLLNGQMAEIRWVHPVPPAAIAYRFLSARSYVEEGQGRNSRSATPNLHRPTWE